MPRDGLRALRAVPRGTGDRLRVLHDAVAIVREGREVTRVGFDRRAAATEVAPEVGSAPATGHAGLAGPETRIATFTLAASARALPEALGELLASTTGAAAADRPIDAEVASAWARLFLVPWRPELTTDARWETFAATRFEQLFGQSAQAWEIRVVPAMPPAPRLAVALPQALLDALRAGCGGRLRSVRVAALDGLSALLDAERRFSGCAVDLQPGFGTLFVLVDGALSRVRIRHFDRIEELAAAVFAEWSAAGDPQRTPALAVAAAGPQLGPLGARLGQALGWTRVVQLPGGWS